MLPVCNMKHSRFELDVVQWPAFGSNEIVLMSCSCIMHQILPAEILTIELERISTSQPEEEIA
jgi:hypothetical protein